jgi:pyruvate formate lyase activating enzyme
MTGAREMTADEIVKNVLKYRSYYGDKGGMTFSGGEPLVQIDFVTEVFKKLKEYSIHTCVDTSGFTFDPENEEIVKKHEELIKYTDLVLLDIKHIDSAQHKVITGHGNENTLAFAKFLSDKGVKTWIRYVLVPSLSDTDEALYKLRDFVSSLSTVEKVEVLPYHSMGKVKYDNLGIDYPLKDEVPPTKDRVANAKQILGVKHND